MSQAERLQLGRWRTAELRQLLEDEDRLELLVRCSDQLQKLRRAAEKLLISNQRLAKSNLCVKPRLRDAKLLLAVKHKELEKIRNLVQVKQEQVEKNSLGGAERLLMRKINQQEEKFELLFHSFSGGKVRLEDFLDAALTHRVLHHVRLVQLKKLQEAMAVKRWGAGLSGGRLEDGSLSLGVPEGLTPLCLTSAMVFPTCCHPHFLLPLSAPRGQQYSQLYRGGAVQVAVRRRGFRRPTRPIRLQPLRRSQQPPPQ